MIKNTLKLVAIALMATAKPALCQSNVDKAQEKAGEAIKEEDAGGNMKDVVKLLEEAQKLDPGNSKYPYELGYAYYLQKDFKKALGYVVPILDDKNSMDLFYELVGDCYDDMGKSDKSIATYSDGLKKFPTSGRLHLEIGIALMRKEKYNDALFHFEKGIEVNPEFASNYYWASRIFCSYSTEKVWGMIYGEIFLNLERTSERSKEISKLLYDTYKSQITFKGDSSVHYSFTEQNTITIKDLKDTVGGLKLPWALSVYEPCLAMNLLKEKSIDLSSLNRIREGFVKNYYDKGEDKKYPNVLFDFQKKISDAGQMEAYNYWLLLRGDESGFEAWQKANKDKWDSFVKWFPENGITIDNDHKFYRGQY